MASTKDYLEFVLDSLSFAEGLRFRPMMGEYLLYYREKLFGGIYDNRFLVKPVPAVRSLMPDAPEEIPYPGAKPMLMVENLEDRDFLSALLDAVAGE